MQESIQVHSTFHKLQFQLDYALAISQIDCGIIYKYMYPLTVMSCDQFVHRINRLIKYFLLVVHFENNGEAQTWKVLYMNIMFLNCIKQYIFYRLP